jgi:hypothetical protein
MFSLCSFASGRDANLIFQVTGAQSNFRAARLIVCAVHTMRACCAQNVQRKFSAGIATAVDADNQLILLE